MTEPVEPQEPQEPQEPVEAPETPQEPSDEPDRRGAEDGDPAPPEGAEQEPSSGQPQGKSEKEIEKGLQALEREAQRHAKRVGEIMEEDAQHLVRCELCAPLIPGFRWPQVPDDQRAAVMLAIGFDPEPDLRADTQSGVCPDCDGWGQVATGSKVQGQGALPCTSCKGKGWRGPRERQAGSIVQGNIPAEIVNGPQPEAPLDPDREAARAAAQAAGFMVIDTRAPAAT